MGGIRVKRIDAKTIYNNIGLFLLGIFGFSILGQHFILNIFHIPFSFMEIYFLPVIWIKRKKIAATFSRMRKVTFSQIMLYILAICGCIWGIFSTLNIGIIIEYRSIVYLLICFFYVQKKHINISLNTIMKVAIYAMLGEMIYVLFFSTGPIVSSTNCIAIAVAIIAAFVLEKYIIAFFCVLCGTFLAINTGFRIGIVIVAICVIEMMFYTVFRKNNNKRISVLGKRFIVIFAVILVAIVVITNYVDIVTAIAKITGMSQFAIFRVTERVLGLFTGNIQLSQDTSRLEIMKYPLERITQVIPRGLIGGEIGEYWAYIDTPMIYLYDIFGSIASFGIICWIFKIFIENVVDYKRYSYNKLKIVSVWMMPVMAVLFLINGTFLVAVFQAMETGFLLGILKNKYFIEKR